MNTVKSIRHLVIISLMAIGLVGVLNSTSCDGGSSTGYGGGGNSTPREFSSGDLTPGSPGESFTHVFNTAKSIPYYCRHHGGPGGVGMSGTIVVSAGGSPSKTNVSITSSTLPDLNIDVGDTVTWTNNHISPYPTVHTVESDN